MRQIQIFRLRSREYFFNVVADMDTLTELVGKLKDFIDRIRLRLEMYHVMRNH